MHSGSVQSAGGPLVSLYTGYASLQSLLAAKDRPLFRAFHLPVCVLGRAIRAAEVVSGLYQPSGRRRDGSGDYT